MQRILVRTLLISLSFLAATAGVLGVQASEGKKEKLNGYAEYRLGAYLVVEGQRVFALGNTEFKGNGIQNLATIPLGYEVKVEGLRLSNGAIMAHKVEAKPNGMAMFEGEVLQATNQIEKTWVSEGRMFNVDSEGNRQTIGRILTSGREVDRVNSIMSRLAPSYVDKKTLRVRVVDTKEWNASAMGNGAIWVYTGLLRETSDNEMAIILGHELAHYTHEHSRRGAKQRMWGQLAAIAGALTAETVDNKLAKNLVGFGALLSVTAWQSGYSRNMEDQADRVGLRYAKEGGYDVTAGPRLWERFREKYGESDVITNFFIGSHSRPSDRIKNINSEIHANYLVRN